MEQIDFAALLQRSAEGGKQSLDEVMGAVYAELRTLARHRLRRAPSERSLNTTGLVHEAYLRLVESSLTAHDRDHFLAIASRAMRNVLVDHARARTSEKRGGGIALEPLHEDVEQGGGRLGQGSAGDFLTALFATGQTHPVTFYNQAQRWALYAAS